jgi:protocatechuate 3,4-dioxygenase beta subunit
MKLTRRQLLKSMAALPIPAAVLSAQGLAAAAGAVAVLEATPEIPDEDDPTPAADEGPFYKPKSPKRSNLIDKGMKGEKVTVSGRVLNTRGEPVPGAMVDVWHADAEGEYDNDGFKCRGHLFADKEGKYSFEAVLPGYYPGRCRHYHVRVQAPNGRPLTTQLFFPDDPRTSRDGIFRRELLMKIKSAKEGRAASFDFVLAP